MTELSLSKVKKRKHMDRRIECPKEGCVCADIILHRASLVTPMRYGCPICKTIFETVPETKSVA